MGIINQFITGGHHIPQKHPLGDVVEVINGPLGLQPNLSQNHVITLW